MLDPKNNKYGKNKLPDFYLPQIQKIDDVYEVGVLCDSKAIKDEDNKFMPYVLNIFPKSKA